MRIDEGCNYYALAYYYYHIGKIYDTTRPSFYKERITEHHVNYG